MLRKLLTLLKNYGNLNISLLENDGLISLRDPICNIIPIVTKEEDKDTILVGQMDQSNMLYGLGKKTHFSASTGYINDGNFKDNELCGFGRIMTYDGYYAIGMFQIGQLYSTRFN